MRQFEAPRFAHSNAGFGWTYKTCHISNFAHPCMYMYMNIYVIVGASTCPDLVCFQSGSAFGTFTLAYMSMPNAHAANVVAGQTFAMVRGCVVVNVKSGLFNPYLNSTANPLKWDDLIVTESVSRTLTWLALAGTYHHSHHSQRLFQWNDTASKHCCPNWLKMAKSTPARSWSLRYSAIPLNGFA